MYRCELLLAVARAGKHVMMAALLSRRLCPAIFIVLWFVTNCAFGQTVTRITVRSTPSKLTAPLRLTPQGEPDLQGTWSNATMTPLQRPLVFNGERLLTEDGRRVLAAELERSRSADRRDGKGTDDDVNRGYNDLWLERGPLLLQTSLITDPPDGRIPPLTPSGAELLRERIAARKEHGPADSWTNRSLQERCLVQHGVPPLPAGYNDNYQIIQAAGYVVITYETIHEVRIIPTSGQRPVQSGVRQFLGDSRGHWEGSTLVIETTNFRTDDGLFEFPASGEKTKIIEHLTRVDGDHIAYQFTVDDPGMYTRPWTAEVPMTRTIKPIYEYACHEGNYALIGILAGTRALERSGAHVRTAREDLNGAKK